jgi:hypothetical protein
VLPHVQQEDGDQGGGQVALVVVQLSHDELLAEGVPRGDGPAGSLDAECRGLELGPERVERPVLVVDGRAELAVRLVATLGGEVLPEDRVVDVAAEVEGQVLLELVDRVERVVGVCLVHLLDRGVQAVHIVLMVLAMVQLHDLARDVRVERTVVIGQIGKCVFSHASS